MGNRYQGIGQRNCSPSSRPHVVVGSIRLGDIVQQYYTRYQLFARNNTTFILGLTSTNRIQFVRHIHQRSGDHRKSQRFSCSQTSVNVSILFETSNCSTTGPM
uniref:Uncharacterized protein n=1 Tax=Cacopsylla melanoneura TaxID=428564 RepID=A0A8D8ZNC4_9HEMI